jgi:putative spermidine/putrescine transport system permease protein
MRSEAVETDGAPLSLKLAAGAGLLFLHLPILLIFVYAFSTEDDSFTWPPPGFTLRWFGAAWERPDIWEALGLSLRVAAISTVVAHLDDRARARDLLRGRGLQQRRCSLPPRLG